MTKPFLQRPPHAAKRGPLGNVERNVKMTQRWLAGEASTYKLADEYGLSHQRTQYIVKRERQRITQEPRHV